MWIAFDDFIDVRQVQLGEQFPSALRRRRCVQFAVQHRRLGELIDQGVRRVERGGGTLGNIRDLVAANLPQPGFR